MKKSLAAAVLVFSAGAAQADGYMMGSGQYNCRQALDAWNGPAIEKGQLAGWIMGYWSAATTARESTFVDTVERVGARNIVETTLRACQKAGPDVMLYRVTQALIRDTK